MVARAAVVGAPRSRHAARRRPRHRGALRSDRAAVHAAVPQRLLHRRRRHDADRSPAGAGRRIVARQRRRRAHRSHRPEPRRRLEPRLADHGADRRPRRRPHRSLPGLADAQRSLDADSPIVLLDATTGERHPFWAELDAIADPGETAAPADPSRRSTSPTAIASSSGCATSSIVPAQTIAPSPAFVAYRDGQRTTDATFEARRPAMERIFADLAAAGVAARRPAAGVGLHRRQHARA